jgi:hypothetical protein
MQVKGINGPNEHMDKCIEVHCQKGRWLKIKPYNRSLTTTSNFLFVSHYALLKMEFCRASSVMLKNINQSFMFFLPMVSCVFDSTPPPPPPIRGSAFYLYNSQGDNCIDYFQRWQDIYNDITQLPSLNLKNKNKSIQNQVAHIFLAYLVGKLHYFVCELTGFPTLTCLFIYRLIVN